MAKRKMGTLYLSVFYLLEFALNIYDSFQDALIFIKAKQYLRLINLKNFF